MDVDASYAYCERLTRNQARNFYYGIRLLPEPKRLALSAVYAFAREIDDIGDGDLPADRKVAELARMRKQLKDLSADRDPVAVALADAATRFPIPLSALDELIDGVEMDVRETEYETFDELRVYCRCVAGTVGRLSLGIFGSRDSLHAPDLADTLGIALQITNILRDIKEDKDNGRVYLPREDLAKFGLEDAWHRGGRFTQSGAFDDMVRFEAERAEQLFERGLTLLPLLDRRSAASTGAMAGIYRRLLTRIREEPGQVLIGRLSLPGWEKAEIAARALAGLPVGARSLLARGR
ncbi:presqualene diphosphate synthase HpnD [Embleya sp. NPDC059237]|uniref:presqualene diphosphate synthase HpnD n=1 Tax=Embleya sp. NPDC059237 TaxID=3346784 RepID=UPI0036751BE1